MKIVEAEIFPVGRVSEAKKITKKAINLRFEVAKGIPTPFDAEKAKFVACFVVFFIFQAILLFPAFKQIQND